MKASEYKDIGQYLHDCRESLRVTVAQAAQALHIRAHYIKAIENGKLDLLPGKAYTKGYIRNYAEFLGLNSQEVLDAYELLLGQKDQEFFTPELTAKQNMPSRRIIAISLAGIFLVYCYWYFAIHETGGVENTIPSVSDATLEMLGLKPKQPMKNEWEKCLNEDNVMCFIHLHSEIIPNPPETYSTTQDATSSQEP